MEPQNQDSSSTNSDSQAKAQPNPEAKPQSQPKILVKQKTLQPSESFVNEMKDESVSQPSSAVSPPAASATSLYPEVSKGIGSTTGKDLKSPAGSGEAENYIPSDKKVSERAPSLKLFAIVLLIFSILGTLSLIGVLSANHLKLSKTNLVSDLIEILPLISAVIFLLSKSVTQVKAFLAVILINYVLGIAGIIYLFATIHNVKFSGLTLIGMIVPVLFLFWAWSVYSQVGSLTE